VRKASWRSNTFPCIRSAFQRGVQGHGIHKAQGRAGVLTYHIGARFVSCIRYGWTHRGKKGDGHIEEIVHQHAGHSATLEANHCGRNLHEWLDMNCACKTFGAIGQSYV
jgi:hypothetical protein